MFFMVIPKIWKRHLRNRNKKDQNSEKAGYSAGLFL